MPSVRTLCIACAQQTFLPQPGTDLLNVRNRVLRKCEMGLTESTVRFFEPQFPCLMRTVLAQGRHAISGHILLLLLLFISEHFTVDSINITFKQAFSLASNMILHPIFIVIVMPCFGYLLSVST